MVSNVGRVIIQYEVVGLVTKAFKPMSKIEKAANVVFGQIGTWLLDTAKFDKQFLEAPMPDAQITPPSTVTKQGLVRSSDI